MHIEIYTFFYKDGIIPFGSDIHIPTMSGNVFCNTKMPIIGDDRGDSISEKNKYYSELTGIYWVWKNTKQDYTGSCHYRRYFTAYEEPVFYKLKRLLYWPLGLWKKRYGLIYSQNVALFKNRIINQSQIEIILKDYDAILPLKRMFRYSVKAHFERYHMLSDLECIQSILTEKYPEYLLAFNKVMNGNRLYANNMFILPRSIFEKYSSWLFDILFEFENRKNLKEYTGYQQRIMGFLSERLLTTWFFHHNFKIKELPIIYFKHFKTQ
jgi:hypothetical protein